MKVFIEKQLNKLEISGRKENKKINKSVQILTEFTTIIKMCDLLEQIT